LLRDFNTENLQIYNDLMKGLSTYKVKTHELEEKLYQTLHLYKEDFTLKQYETLIWALSRFIKA
jgi:hypothetical protein